jgi:hypothetical protein
MTSALSEFDGMLSEQLPAAGPNSRRVPKAASATPMIDAVVAELSDVLEWSIAEGSRLGYFAALYLRVTREVQRGVQAGEFDDGPRMDRLDGLFARRYLDAVASHRAGKPMSASWKAAFDTAERNRPLILQHLFLGINAHINLDLGIAALQTLQGGAPLSSLQADFNRINAVLSSLVDQTENSLARAAPLMSVLDWFAGRADEMLADFSIEVARDGAWAFAEALAAASESERAQQIAMRDADIAALGYAVAKPGLMLSLAILPFRLLERGGPAEITRCLAG